MFIKAGTRLMVSHKRKGRFEGKAARDFDTETEEFYPIITLERLSGMSQDWEVGERVECRNDLTKIMIIE